MSKFNIVTINTRGLNDHCKRRKLFKWLVDHKIDIAFLQETYCTKDFISIFNSGYSGTALHSVTDSKHSRGVAILMNNKLNVKVKNQYSSNNGRNMLVNVEIDDDIYTLVSVYAPNIESERVHHFNNLRKWISEHTLNDNNIIVAGDMNCCLLDQDRNSCTHLKDKSRVALRGILEYIRLKDLWHVNSNKDIGYTYMD